MWGERGEGVEEEEGARVCGRSGDAEGEKPVLWFKTTFFFSQSISTTQLCQKAET